MTTRLRLFAGGGMAVAVVAIIAAFLWFRVCDEQLTSTGKIVTVCRHMATTDPPIVVLGAVVLVLLSMFYAEISGFGVTLRRKVAEIDERADDLQETVGDLTEFNRKRVVPETSSGQEVTSASPVPDPRIADLADQYNRLRWTMPSGEARTRRMTGLFEQLQDVLRDVSDFDVVGHLAHHDRGVRLAGYAYLATHPAPELMSELVNTAAEEDKPFGQYCALQATIFQRDNGVPLSKDNRTRLREMAERSGPTTDRALLIADLLS